MWSRCNKCITSKCTAYYRENCEQDSKLVEQPERPIVPPCRQKPNSSCNNRNPVPTRAPSTKCGPNGCDPGPNPNMPGSGNHMRIVVNGKIVSTMEEALELIKTEMSSSVTPNCEPGSKFSQFNSIVSNSQPALSNGNNQAVGNFKQSSQGFPDTNTKSIGEMLLEQSANYDENDRVNITITVNGVVHNYGSFGELFADTETMEQVSNIIA